LAIEYIIALCDYERELHFVSLNVFSFLQCVAMYTYHVCLTYVYMYQLAYEWCVLITFSRLE